jgi:hypothetical protein
MSEERIKTKVQMGILKPAHEVKVQNIEKDKLVSFTWEGS